MDTDTATPFRSFVGDQWVIERSDNNEGDIEVYITRIQSADGLVDRKIAVSQLHWENPITAPMARRLTRVLLAAVDAVDVHGRYDES
jgi:hypothetical protein